MASFETYAPVVGGPVMLDNEMALITLAFWAMGILGIGYARTRDGYMGAWLWYGASSSLLFWEYNNYEFAHWLAAHASWLKTLGFYFFAWTSPAGWYWLVTG